MIIIDEQGRLHTRQVAQVRTVAALLWCAAAYCSALLLPAAVGRQGWLFSSQVAWVLLLDSTARPLDACVLIFTSGAAAAAPDVHTDLKLLHSLIAVRAPHALHL